MKKFYRYAATAGRYGTMGKENPAKGLGIPWKNISIRQAEDMFPTAAVQIVLPNRRKS